MRSLLLAVLLLATPLAAAQVPAAPSTSLITVALGAAKGPLIPFQPAVALDVTTQVSCTLAAQSPQAGLTVTYDAATKPSGVVALVVPATDVADAKQCNAGFVTLHAQAFLTTSASVAAFQDAEITVEAKAAPTSGAQSANAVAKVPVGYYGGLQMSAPVKVKEVRPGDADAFVVTVRNNGNAPSAVAFDVAATEGLKVAPLAAITLGTTAEGGDPAGASADVRIPFSAVAAEGPVNRGDPITVKATPSAQKDATQTGPTVTLGLRVNTIQVTPQDTSPKKSPAGTLLPFAALGIALFLRKCRPLR